MVDSSGRPLLDLFPCSALFGLTVDTCVCQSTEAWACWLRCTSRCVPSWFSGPGALHHGRYGSPGAVCVLVLPGVYRFPVFMEDHFMFYPYSELSLVQQRIHAVRKSMERKNFVFFYMKRWITDPEIDSRSRNTFYCLLYLTVTCSLRRLRST